MKLGKLEAALLIATTAIACSSRVSHDPAGVGDAGPTVPGVECDSDAVCDDGKSCNGAETCVAGYCEDPAPCASPECAIDNGGCPYTATCSVDNSGVVCSCKPGFQGDGTTCTAVWERFDTLTVPELGSGGIEYIGALGNRIYFANDNSPADPSDPAVFRAYDVITKQMSDETANPEAFSGYDANAYSAPPSTYSSFPIGLDGQLYYLAGDGFRYDLSTQTWTKTAFDAAQNMRDRPGTAVLGGKIYEVGSTDLSELAQFYDPASDSWSAPERSRAIRGRSTSLPPQLGGESSTSSETSSPQAFRPTPLRARCSPCTTRTRTTGLRNPTSSFPAGALGAPRRSAGRYTSISGFRWKSTIPPLTCGTIRSCRRSARASSTSAPRW